MEYGRQYFTTCLDDGKYNDSGKTYIYVISGFNHEYQILLDVEKFCWETQRWEWVEPIHTARINAAACKCGKYYIYLFGGMDVERNEFTDTIERYNQ